ncbi:uncharacterized protein LOC128330520 [Hemicordylus capensis]|uniref:uncharacterized protein LOC128330520 n=1 Tax=Hemicordylus capensis TaxID=884348 RepID=UPI002303A5CA|nr:uncharacterized protein LOC128330520 [Hemicordylus capensis]
MEINSGSSFQEASQEEKCVLAAHYGPELEVPARSQLPSRKKEQRRRSQQLTQEHPANVPSGLGDLVLAAEWMKDTSESHCHQDSTEVAALRDHNTYCIPQEAETLKSLVRELKDTVHRQSELLFSLQGALEASQKECQALQEKVDAENWALLSNLREHVSQLETENRNLRCERDQLEATVQRLRKELDASGATVLSLSRQLRGQHRTQAPHGAFSLESVKGDAKWLRFYTSFDEYPRLTAFLDFLLDGKREEGSPESGSHSALSPENQLFLVLVRLRLGLLLQDLAFRFHISESTASRYWLSWTEFMERRLKQIPVTCSQRYVDAFKPQRLIQHHDMSLVTLDCAEFFFEAQGRTRGRDTPQGPRARYSMSGCALAAPSGFLTFGTGTGEELPTLPPFLQAGPVELTAQQEATKRQVLSLRSLTDKAFSFRFLRVVHPQNMEGQVGRAWIISCYLACLLHEPMGLP